jgi:hypothetical protein
MKYISIAYENMDFYGSPHSRSIPEDRLNEAIQRLIKKGWRFLGLYADHLTGKTYRINICR